MSYSAEHWSIGWIGRPYRRGEYDCADLVVEVMCKVFATPLTFPPHAHGVRARDEQIRSLQGDFAVPIPPGLAVEGDAVLMQAAGRTLSLGHHIGVYAVISGEPCVLHCMAGINTALHPIATLEARQLEVVGYYRWLRPDGGPPPAPQCDPVEMLKARATTMLGQIEQITNAK